MTGSLKTGVGLVIGLALGTALQLGARAAQQPPPTQGGRGREGGFTEPSPMDFNDHEGYVRLFDGVSLKGWDGNPKFWRVEDGAIVGESTPANPSGNSYIVVARGGTFLHIVNGQLMSAMIDDDPSSSNNESGLFGIEIAATTKVFVRAIWVKKLN